ncbi:MAG: hypothetical protein EA412_14670, partial [Chitinophagaceae bacterium]
AIFDNASGCNFPSTQHPVSRLFCRLLAYFFVWGAKLGNFLGYVGVGKKIINYCCEILKSY